MFPKQQGFLLRIEDLTNDPSNPSCLSNRTGLTFGDSTNSSLTILSNSLQSNQLYQFMVQMTNRQNSSQQIVGYVLVQIQGNQLPMIAIGCVIETMCSPNLEFQLVNPTTQVALFSLCLGNCSSIQHINWKIYSGQINSSSNSSLWILFNQTNSYFFGINTSNFTSTNQLFIQNPQIKLWKFEVIYSFLTEISVSSLNFVINQPPVNGSCSISPTNGTITTLFQISCLNWFDEDEIKDYSLYSWINDPHDRILIAFSTVSTFQIRFPSGNLHLIVQIRDQLNCLTEFNLSSLTVSSDIAAIEDLMWNFQSSSNPIIQLLLSENQNVVGQILTSISQELNKMNSENINKATSNGILSATISVSSLGSQRLSSVGQLNQSVLIEFTKDLNSQSNVREYLISFVVNLPITTSNSILLQSSTLAQLTKATNQLTRTTLSIATEKCFQLTNALYSMGNRISFEDVQLASSNLIQCVSHLLTGVNGPLQRRTTVLDLDQSRSNSFINDYEIDFESEWTKMSSSEDRNSFYQKKLSNQIENEMNEILSKINSILKLHLNVGQQTTMNTTEVFISVQTESIESLANKQIDQIANASIRFPPTFQTNLISNSTISIRSMLQPLASFGNSKSSANTNLSTSISFSLTDQNRTKVSVKTNENNPIEILIPRDPNLEIPPMKLQNVTNYSSFNLHYVNLSSSLSISVHIEFRSLNQNLSYLLIYKFDQIPQLNSSTRRIDGWSIICPSNLSDEGIFTFFLDNLRTQGHQLLVFGLRELNFTESLTNSNPPIVNDGHSFTSNYELRIYGSGCYYLNENNEWKSDGLRVGPKTNRNQTQCFSNHL